MKAKHPWLKFYPSDWRGSAKLKSCTAVARAVLLEMMCIMHDADDYGFLEIAGSHVSDADLAAQSGLPLRQITAGRVELEKRGVIERDAADRIYSPRMVRDEDVRARRAKGGKLGGNPSLLREDNRKVNHDVTHKGYPQIPDARIPDIKTSSSLRAWLGDLSPAVDRLATSADHGQSWETGIYALYGPEGTDSEVWKDPQTGERSPPDPAIIAKAIDRYAAEGKPYNGLYFRRFIERARDEKNGKHQRDHRPDRRKGADQQPRPDKYAHLTEGGGADTRPGA